jgi:hypothetical protein
MKKEMHMLHSAKLILGYIYPGPSSPMNLQTIKSKTISPSSPLFLSRLLPVIVPAIRRRGISLHASILDREHISEDTLLVHRDTEQLSSITRASAQLLTRLLHALVLAHQLELVLAALLGPEQLPGAMDGPVSKVTVAGEAEGTGGERVVEEVADES